MKPSETIACAGDGHELVRLVPWVPLSDAGASNHGALPVWPYSGAWGHYPSGGLGLILLIVLLVTLFGRGRYSGI